ncbi:MAG: hypothetical protein J3Q66DRAFT_284296, partial [Benniella sp.]
ELFEEASGYKAQGNQYFGQGNYTEALKYYQLALTTCPNAACHIKLKEYQQAIEASNAALDLDPSFTRALQRRAQAGELVETFSSMSQAKEDHERVAGKKKHRMMIQTSEQALRRMEPRLKELMEKEKAEMLAKLKSMGNTILGKFGLSTDNFQMKQDPSTGGYSFNFVNHP